MDIQISSKVLIEGGRSGVVRYYGPVGGKTGNWVGVELDFALGKNDGTVAGKQYFRCKPLHGIFVNPSKVITMPLSPSGDPLADAPPRHPPTAAHPAANHSSSLADRLQQAAVVKEVPSQVTISRTDALPPVESPFKMPIKKPADLADKTPGRTPLQPSASARALLSPAVRNVEDLQAEIRRLHEQKLELIDKLAEADRTRHPEERKAWSKAEAQLLDLQCRLKEKEAAAEELAQEKDNLVSQLAKVQSQHFSETTRLRLEIDDLNARSCLLDKSQSADTGSAGGPPGREIGIETAADHHRLSVIRSFDEERDAIRRRLEATQEQLDSVTRESNLARDTLKSQLASVDALYQQCQARLAGLTAENSRLHGELQAHMSESSKRVVDPGDTENLREQLKRAKDECFSATSALNKLQQASATSKPLHDSRERELLQLLDDKNRLIAALSSTQAREATRPSPSSVESVRFRLEQSVCRISELQTAYTDLRRSYEQLREAKKREESYFLSQLSSAESSVVAVSDAKYDQLLSENSSLAAKLEQYKRQVEELNVRLVNGMDTMDKLEDALSTIDHLSNEINSLNLKHQQEMDSLTVQLKNSRRSNERSSLGAVPQGASAQSTKENNRNADNAPVEKDLVIDSLERDIKILERQLSRTTSGSVSDASYQSGDLMKRIGRLKSSFRILDQTRYLEEAVELEKKIASV